MLARIKHLLQQLVRKSTYLRHEPVNKVSIIILILVDIFVLFNVFSGLDSIARWPLTPAETFPCFAAYERYQTSPQKGSFEFNVATVESLLDKFDLPSGFSNSKGSRLGRPSNLCENITGLTTAIQSDTSIRQLKKELNQERNNVTKLEQEIQTLQSQYDSTLLEKIAGQSPQKSINKVPATEIKESINRNKLEIKERKNKIQALKSQLLQKDSPKQYLGQLNSGSKYQVVKRAYESDQFWHPNRQFALQVLFLLPLILLAYTVHQAAIRRSKDLLALLSWHLLLIFCIPLLLKIFEFLQFGNLVSIIIDGITTLLGGLLFLGSYLLILIIPLLGFGLIKFLQRFIFNPKIQARNRIQKVRCINCNFKLGQSDAFCPSCGFNQFIDCPKCHQLTYQFTSFCKSCGERLENQ
jgi:predicted RNA-binding Zn-ribbon protein involved in translation (DUF1610 family)